MILYAFISWMEDSGYMARAAFIMDKIMHKMGLHGKSFIPMIMGFGCNIPAIMATRTIEDRKSRLLTMLIVPMMSCSARLPVYIIVIGAFFPKHQALTLFTIYLIGIVMSVLMAKLFNKFVVKGESSPFVMELPPYRLPSAKSVARHTWEKGKQYLKKMGTIILAASIVVWALAYFPHHDDLTKEQQMEQSYIGQLGKAVEPAIRPCGLQWKEGVSLITGVGAKEIVASTMGVLYANNAEDVEAAEESDSSHLSKVLATSGMTPLAAFAFMVFVLLYMPCLPACIAIKHESGKWKWALFTAFYTTCLAWICATLVFQIGSLI
jgi:ferrous iron transport protein B